MTGPRTLVRDESGAAAAEMALVTPLLLILMLGTMELGQYFYHEHKLVQSLRNAARHAARQPFDRFATCNATPGGTVEADAKAIARTGQISGGADRLPNWGDGTTVWTVTTRCSTGSGSVVYSGIYAGMTSGSRSVEVSADLPYRSIFALVGLSGSALRLRATQQAAVAGI